MKCTFTREALEALASAKAVRGLGGNLTLRIHYKWKTDGSLEIVLTRQEKVPAKTIKPLDIKPVLDVSQASSQE